MEAICTTVYKSFDGTVYEDEKDCTQHDRELLSEMFFDLYGGNITPEEMVPAKDEDFFLPDVIYVKDIDSLEILKAYFRSIHADYFINMPGFYYYSYDIDEYNGIRPDVLKCIKRMPVYF